MDSKKSGKDVAKSIRDWLYKNDDKEVTFFGNVPILTEYLDSEQYRVFSYIFRFVQMNGDCYFKYDVVTRKLRISNGTISKALTGLRSMGLLVRKYNPGGNNVYYTISAEAIYKIIKITNMFKSIPAWEIKDALVGINLNAVDLSYLVKAVEKYFGENEGVGLELFDDDCLKTSINRRKKQSKMQKAFSKK